MWWWKDAFLRLRALFFRRRWTKNSKRIAVSSGDAGEKESLRGTHPKRQDARPPAVRGFESAKEECRDARGVNFVETLSRDLRYAFRVSPHSWVHSVACWPSCWHRFEYRNISVVYAVLLAPLPYPNLTSW